MSSLTRRNTLAQSVLAAVRGKTNGKMEDDRPEDMEEGDQEEAAESEEDDAAAEDAPEDEQAEDDEPADGDEEPKEDPQASGQNRIRRAEQSRIRAILTHPKAEANPGLANELAFGSKFYSAKSAVALLESSAPGGQRLGDRMQGRSPKLGSGGGGDKATERQALVAGVGKVIKAMHGRSKKEA